MSRKTLIFEEAKRAIEANFKPAFLGEEDCVLLEASNRVLSQEVSSPIDIPPSSIANVSGYAVRAKDLVIVSEDEPSVLQVVGVIGVGEVPKAVLAKGEAFEVAAGAMLPEGANAVLATQDASREDDTLLVYSTSVEGENLVKKGSDIQKGVVVLKKGQVLGPSEIGVAAALGLEQVKVLKIPMVAVLSIGSEVNELGKPLTMGKSFDVNGYSLSTAVIECGGKPVYFGAVPDDKASLKRVLKTAVASSDMVIACGGVSDMVEIADSLGKPGIILSGLAVKPGKNTAVAFVSEKPVFLLPSNPSAALLMFQLLARSLVQRLAGRPASDLKAVAAYAGSRMFSAKGSRTFVSVKLLFDEQCRLIAEPIESMGGVSALVGADGFVEIAENEQFLDVDQEVEVRLLRGSAGKA